MNFDINLDTSVQSKLLIALYFPVYLLPDAQAKVNPSLLLLFTEVHGGLHSFQAIEELAKEGAMSETSFMCDVYVYLNDEETLWLASRHNRNGHFNHHMTHRNYLEVCRASLFAMHSDATEVPSNLLQWRKVCTNCILLPEISRTQKENIFAQSTFHSEIWDEVNDVMNMFEEGELKGQSKGGIPKQHHLNLFAGEPCGEAVKKFGDYIITLVEGSLQACSSRAIKKANTSYNGAHLILSNIRKDCTSESLEKIVYNSRELNTSFTGINFFSFIVMVELADVDMVKEALSVCYNKIEVVYIYNELASKPSRSTHTLLLV
uniref:Uncharacterized protein n=1 Tax=Amphimedon queenslandica TaxID=400682 RepID=A0A1X7UV86_AMPQE